MRLKKSKIYYLCLIFTLGLSLFSVLVPRSLSSVTGAPYEIERFCYDVGPFLAVIIPVFTGLFIRSEFSDGAIRNKMVVGCRRRDIYLAELMSVSLADLGLVAAWFLGGLAGVPRFGMWQGGVPALLMSLLTSVLFTLVLSAIFTLFGMMIQSKAAGSVAAILVGLGLIFGASLMYNKLLEPEFSQTMVLVNNEVQMSEPEPNPEYVGGAAREAMKFAVNALPTGQAILLANDSFDDSEQIKNLPQQLASSLAEFALLAAIGPLAFKKKDVR